MDEKINIEKINEICDIEKLKLEIEEKEEILTYLEESLEKLYRLKDLKTDDTLPLFYLNEEVNLFRKDEFISSKQEEKILANAPSRQGDYIKVPKTL